MTGRALAALLAVLLAPTLTLSLLAVQACGTLLSPGFYKEQLDRAAVYDFLYDDLLPAAVSDALETGEGLPPGLSLQADDVVVSVREALPPGWLQEQAEAAIDSAGPYLLGRADVFTLSIDLSERADAAETAFADLLKRVDLYEALFAESVPEAVASRLGDRDLPFGVHLTEDEAIAAAKRVVTPEHVRLQQSQAAEALAAYLVGRADAFRFTFSFKERAAALEWELAQVLHGADLESYVRREALEPALDENITADVALPLGVIVSREEIQTAIETAVTSEWLHLQTLRLVDDVVPYFSARHDEFYLTVPLLEPTNAAIRELSLTVTEKYVSLVAALPQCSPQQMRDLTRGLSVELCLPPGFTAQDLLGLLGIDVEASLSAPVHRMTPDTVTFTQADLLTETRGASAGEAILDLRETMRAGLPFDENDVREALAERDPDLPAALDTLREGFSDGWTWTEQDLRSQIDDPDALDRGRGAIASLRVAAVLAALTSVALVAGAGLLGSRSRPGMLGWAGGAVASAALAALILTGPVHDAVLGGAVQEARAETAAGVDGTARIVTDKLWETVVQANNDFIGGVRLRAGLLILLGVAALAAGVGLAQRRARPPAREGAAAGGDTANAAPENAGQAGSGQKQDAPASGEPQEP